MRQLRSVKKIKFKYFSDANGILIPIGGKKSIPFNLARLFYIFNLKKGDIRGDHAHKKCQQLLICLRGECQVICDNGKKRQVFKLNKPKMGLYIPPMIWVIQKFNKNDSILLVLTDQKFKESDYIRDYKKFLASI